MNSMLNKKFPFVEECLKGKNCNNCKVCNADIESWNQLESDFSENNTDYTNDLKIYYTIRGKRKSYLQKKNSEYLVISEPEALNILSRY